MRLTPLSRASRKRRAQRRAQRASLSAHNTIIQKFIDELDAKVYLEIGYFHGGNFVNIQCAVMYTCDPEPRGTRKYLKHKLSNVGKCKTKLFAVTSDDFFRSQNSLLAKTPLDVVYVDGLHTFEQSLRDVINAFKFLSPGGVVFVDDCNPRDAAIAMPAISLDEAKEKVAQANENGRITDKWSGEWCGDVWKTIAQLRNYDCLNVTVLDTHTGLGVVTLKPGAEFIEPHGAPPELLKNDPYEMLAGNRKTILDLQPVESLQAVLHKHCIGRTQ